MKIRLRLHYATMGCYHGKFIAVRGKVELFCGLLLVETNLA
jgi:hypothetical protein